jgi:hypothetical protein
MPGSNLEISQHDLQTGAEQVTEKLERLLNLTLEQKQGVLKFLKSERPESTGSSLNSTELFVEDMDWPDSQKQDVLRVSATIAAEWGYRLSRARPAPEQAVH